MGVGVVCGCGCVGVGVGVVCVLSLIHIFLSVSYLGNIMVTTKPLLDNVQQVGLLIYDFSFCPLFRANIFTCHSCIFFISFRNNSLYLQRNY